MDIETYVRENPKVWEAFKHFTLEAARAGRTHFSARTVIERVRWDTMLKENGCGEFKINNNVAPKLARRFMSRYPGYEGFFRTRG